MENIIPYLRRKKNIKQYDMARALKVSPSNLCKIEKGIKEPTEKFKQACSRFLNARVAVSFRKRRPRENEEHQTQFQEQALERSKGKPSNSTNSPDSSCALLVPVKVEKGLQGDAAFKTMCARILKTRESSFFVTIPPGQSYAADGIPGPIHAASLTDFSYFGPSVLFGVFFPVGMALFSLTKSELLSLSSPRESLKKRFALLMSEPRKYVTILIAIPREYLLRLSPQGFCSIYFRLRHFLAIAA